MNEFTHIKKKYLGYEKNPFDQFSRLMSATANLPKEVREDQGTFVGLLRNLRTGMNRSAPRELLAFQILNELKSIDEAKWKGEYLTFLSNLRRSNFWIESTLSESRVVSESENTIFSPQPFHFQDSIFARKLESHAELRTFGTSKSRLFSLISYLNSHLTKGDRPARIQTFLTKRLLLDALSEINYEVTDNANWHALKTLANSNYQESRDETFYGNMLYLQFHNFSRSNVPEIEIGSIWPDDLVTYVREYVELSREKDARFVVASYVDNGPGVLEHIRRHLHGSGSTGLSIRSVIKDGMTTRDILGAGQGLTRVLLAMRALRGLLVLTSGGTRYIFCGITGSDQEHMINNSRGTMFTLFVPV